VVPHRARGHHRLHRAPDREPLTRALGQPVVVDNKPGASGNIGNQFVARAKPDGYTLLVSYSGYHVGNPHLFKQAGWDPIKDFAPVAMMTRAPQVITINPKLPANNLQEPDCLLQRRTQAS
jgi:tripartite-type tricarboxylate transporter receptor subunit TctC